VGFALEPIYKSVPQAVKQDSRLYAVLALLDSIRIGGARERGFASDLLTKMLEGRAECLIGKYKGKCSSLLRKRWAFVTGLYIEACWQQLKIASV